MIETNLGRKIVVVVLVVAAVVAGAYLVRRWIERAGERPRPVQIVSEETRSVTLYFANREADGFEAETREIPVREGLESEVEAVMAALIEGPRGRDGISAIPPGTALLQVFWSEETQTLYLNFNRTIVSAHPGGSAGEYYTLGTIIRTIGANFPQARNLQLLVDGHQVETLAGHYAIDRPIEIMKWR